MVWRPPRANCQKGNGKFVNKTNADMGVDKVLQACGTPTTAGLLNCPTRLIAR